jgi:hypothetical protein
MLKNEMPAFVGILFLEMHVVIFLPCDTWEVHGWYPLGITGQKVTIQKEPKQAH